VDAQTEAPWLTDLQPLAKKDANALCWAIFSVLKEFALGMRQPENDKAQPTAARRLVHVVVGDSVAANGAAAKRLLPLVQSHTSEADSVFRGWQYRLINIRCASHQANLAVRTAIGGQVRSATSLEANAVRFYKYLLSEYHEEFVLNCRTILADQLVVRHWVDLDEQERFAVREARTVSATMQNLYGKDALPDTLLEHLNMGLGCWAHLVGRPGDPREGATDRATEHQLVVQELLKALDDLCLRTGETRGHAVLAGHTMRARPVSHEPDGVAHRQVARPPDQGPPRGLTEKD
jgi:hypothetical protein